MTQLEQDLNNYEQNWLNLNPNLQDCLQDCLSKSYKAEKDLGTLEVSATNRTLEVQAYLDAGGLSDTTYLTQLLSIRQAFQSAVDE